MKKSATKLFHRKIKIYDDQKKKNKNKKEKKKKNLFFGIRKK